MKPEAELSFEQLLEKHRRSQTRVNESPEEDSAPREPTCATETSKTEKRKKKTTKKSLFPVSSRTEVSSAGKVGTDCLDIARFRSKTAESVDPLCNGLAALQLKKTGQEPPG